MEKIKTYGIIISAVIIVIILSILGNYFFFSDKTYSHIYEVDEGSDNGRTFTVEGDDQGYGNENGSWALLQLSPTYSFGVKFDNIKIPKGANIMNAYVELYCVGTPGHQNPNCKIYCDDVDNAKNFQDIGVLDISGRKYTYNYVVWNDTATYGKWIQTSSINLPINEVINRDNWQSGNSIAILFVSQGLSGYSCAFENFENDFPPRLSIDWSES